MRLSTWNRRIAVTGCCAAVGLAAVAPIASAQPAPTPAPVAPITLSPQESQQVCSDMLPKLEQRVDRLIKQINGGPDVKGSVQSLKTRAQDQRTKKHDKVADRLDQRAQRRAERINDLNQTKQRLDAFRSQHCQPAGGAQ
jgi:hypothetical protein